MCPAYSCTYFFRSDLVGNQLFRLWIAGVNAICFSSLVNSLVSGLAMVYCPRSLVSNQIYHRTDGIMLASSKCGKRQSWLWRLAGGQEPIRNGEIFWSNNNLSCTLFNYSLSCENFFNVQCRCTFERSLCRWTQLSDDDFDWTRNQGSTASYGTGPMFDHTLGSAAGNSVSNTSKCPR